MKKIMIMLLALAATVAVHANVMENCGWCGGSGKGKEIRKVHCSQCGGYKALRCRVCHGSGRFVYLNRVMVCQGCFGRGQMICFGCGGSGIQMKVFNTQCCNVCRGNKIVPARVNAQLRAQLATIVQMNNQMMQYNNNPTPMVKPVAQPVTKPISFGMDRTCSICGTQWHAIPGAMSCPKCSAPKY